MAALLLYALIILVVFIISCIPQNVNAQSTSSGDVLPGRGIIIVNHQAVIDSNIVMLAQRAADSITNLKATIASKVTLAAAIAGLSMTTTGTLGAASYNNISGVFNIPQYAGTVTSVGLSSSDFTVSGSPVTTSGSITANLNTSGISAGTYGIVTVTNKGIATAGKRSEMYSGTTNGSGVYSVTYGTAYSASPNIQLQIVGGSSNQIATCTVSTTGFTVTVVQRSSVNLLGIDVLLSATTNVSGAAVDVIINEK